MHTQERTVGAGEHIVHFYEDDLELSRVAGSYLAEALRAGAVALMIATAPHRRTFEAELEASGIDTAKAISDGTLVSLDAAATTASFIQDGQIDRSAFYRTIGRLVRQAVETGRAVRIYGEMVALLWDAGDVLAALELEKLWNELGADAQFSLLCAYRSEAVSDPGHEEAFQTVCELHSSVLHAPRGWQRSAGQADPGTLEVVHRFPAHADSPWAARHFIAEVLTQWGYSRPLLNDAQLVLSELATNAVVHARSPFSVVVRSENSCVRLSVHDASPVKPTCRFGGPTRLSGRGLHVVAALAADWGVEVTNDGKAVWARLTA